MNTERKSTGALASLSLLLGFVLMGSAACSNDSPEDSTSDLFTPTTGTTTALIKVDTVTPEPMPSKGATLYLIDVKLAQSGAGRVTEEAQFQIANCYLSVTYNGQEWLSAAPLVDDQGASACRPGATPEDLGAFLVGTSKKTGSLTFTISMYDMERKLTAQGSTVALPVQPDGVVSQDLVANATP
jgi:hypothetical protein